MNKDECEKALEYMHCPIINTMTEEMAYEILNNLINEHFELVEKVEWLKEEMTEQSFYFVFSTQDFLHSWYRGIQITGAENAILQRKLSEYENPQPYKFEDLKPNMWVWDDVEKKCNKIIEILENKEISFYYITDNVSRYIVKFEENRFYPVTKALCEVNER